MKVHHSVSQKTLGDRCMPNLSIEEVRAIQREGFARIGRAFALVTVDGKLLTGLHHNNGQNGHPKRGLKGPLSETVAGNIDAAGRLVGVESMRQTFARCIQEELGVLSSDLPLFFGHNKSAPTTEWSVGHRRTLLAQTAVLFLDPNFDHEQFVKTFRPTPELKQVEFLCVDQFVCQKLRPGAKEWAELLDTHCYFQPEIPLVLASPVNPQPTASFVDLRLDEMPNL